MLVLLSLAHFDDELGFKHSWLAWATWIDISLWPEGTCKCKCTRMYAVTHVWPRRLATYVYDICPLSHHFLHASNLQKSQ